MKIYLVGGAVRDKLLGLPVKERDWVVVGATNEDMLALGYRQVGKEFPVFLHPKTHEEYALARMEKKVGAGYKGFTFDTSDTVSLEEDLIRRDLTINAMAEEQETGAIIDPYHGQDDLKARLLRHVSPSFAEDPVRVLRISRFLARYAHLGFHVAPETIALMREMVAKGEVNALVAERVWKELERALGEPHPEKFFTTLAECRALPILFPSIAIPGAGIEALVAASAISSKPIVRFAALLYDSSEPRKDITVLCDRYKVPNAYRELALLSASHYKTALKTPTLSADALLTLFSALDIYRRGERFDDFILTCQAIAKAKQIEFNNEQLMTYATAAKNVNVKALISEGLSGNDLALRIQAERRANILKRR